MITPSSPARALPQLWSSLPIRTARVATPAVNQFGRPFHPIDFSTPLVICTTHCWPMPPRASTTAAYGVRSSSPASSSTIDDVVLRLRIKKSVWAEQALMQGAVCGDMTVWHLRQRVAEQFPLEMDHLVLVALGGDELKPDNRRLWDLDFLHPTKYNTIIAMPLMEWGGEWSRPGEDIFSGTNKQQEKREEELLERKWRIGGGFE